MGLIQLDDSGITKIEAGVVAADNAIVLTYLEQILRSSYSSRNHGIGIDHSTRKRERR